MHTIITITDIKCYLCWYVTKTYRMLVEIKMIRVTSQILNLEKCKFRESNPDLLNQNFWRCTRIYWKVPQVILIDGQIRMLVRKHVKTADVNTRFNQQFLLCISGVLGTFAVCHARPRLITTI